jgi:hypothetical protein
VVFIYREEPEISKNLVEILGASLEPGGVLHYSPQLVDRQAQRIRNDLHRVQRRIGLTSLQAAQVRLIEAAPLAKFNLAQAGLDA